MTRVFDRNKPKYRSLFAILLCYLLVAPLAGAPEEPLPEQRKQKSDSAYQPAWGHSYQQSGMLLAAKKRKKRERIRFRRSKKSKIDIEATRRRVREQESDTELNERIGRLKHNPRRLYVLNPKRWYFKMSTNISYFTLGPEFNRVISDIEAVFGGKEIETNLLVFNTKFGIKTDTPVKRAQTNFVPTGNVGFGYFWGDHQIEVDFGIAGLVPLNTVNADTTMTLKESQTCTTPQLDDCTMAKLGFVDQGTGEGQYTFNMVINERVWLIQPSVYYDYVFMRREWGRLSVGLSAGLVFLSAKQSIEFRGTRTDAPDNLGAILNPFATRTLEGTAESTAINNIGPIGRIYIGFKRGLIKGIASEIRLGFNYGFVSLGRSVDGVTSASMGDALVASFPTSSLGFADEETNKFELLGAFLQMGLTF